MRGGRRRGATGEWRIGSGRRCIAHHGCRSGLAVQRAIGVRGLAIGHDACVDVITPLGLRDLLRRYLLMGRRGSGRQGRRVVRRGVRGLVHDFGASLRIRGQLEEHGRIAVALRCASAAAEPPAQGVPPAHVVPQGRRRSAQPATSFDAKRSPSRGRWRGQCCSRGPLSPPDILGCTCRTTEVQFPISAFERSPKVGRPRRLGPVQRARSCARRR